MVSGEVLALARIPHRCRYLYWLPRAAEPAFGDWVSQLTLARLAGMSATLPAANSRYAIVTGGGSGIGRAICLRLVAQGWHVAIVDCNPAAADETLSMFPAAGDSLALEIDVADADAWQQLLFDLQARWPRLDLLVNNAGVLVGGELAACEASELRRLIEVNLVGTLLGCRAVIPWLVESTQATQSVTSDLSSSQPRRGIINTASIFATVAPPGFSIYNATKAGVVAASESLRGELAPQGLNVTVTLPGAVGTGLFRSARFSTPTFGEAAQRFVSQAELTPDAVAEATLRAAAAGQAVAVIGRRAKRFAWLKRWLPTLTRHLVVKQARRELGIPAPRPSESPAEISAATKPAEASVR
ncbi:MAG: SDR family oxidoreductase [Planctomycetota bacterium]